MRFTKMHGIGNDYVYVNAFETNVAEPEKLAVQIADRHFGVGGDGLILVAPPTPDGKAQGAHVRMRMFNADGSESEMCGNGVRCVAKFAFDRQLSLANPMKVETGRGVLTISLTAKAGKVETATVNMGQPILEGQRVPVVLPRGVASEPIINVPWADYIAMPPASGWVAACGLEPGMTCVSMGNPHLILFCKHVRSVPLEVVGPFLERQPIFPRRINVHVVQVNSDTEVTMRTWERGSGITLACGTGASAVAVAAALNKKTRRKILAHLPGGDLTLDWNEKDQCVYMTGPATEVFTGEWPERKA